MKFTMTVTPIEGDPYDVIASFPEIVAAEERFDKPISDTLDRYTTTLYLGWSAAKRHGKTDAGFDEWLTTIDGCAIAVDAPTPTKPVRSLSS